MPSFCKRDEEAVEYHLLHRGVPLTVRCRVLEYGLTDRPEPSSFRHPDPPFARLFFFHRGGAEILLRNGERHRLRQDIAYLLAPGMHFDVCYGVSQLIYFHLDIGDVAGRPVFAGLEEPLALDDAGLAEKFRRGCFEAERFTALEALTGALGVWLRPHWDGLARVAERTRRFARLFEYLDRTPPGRATVKELAALYRITPNALSKRFRQYLGIPLKHYLLQRLLLRARELLLHSDLKVGEVAALLGCGDSQYFQRLFKAHFGATPGHYRRLGRER